MRLAAAYLGVIAIWSTTPLAIQWSAQALEFSFAVFARMAVGLGVCMALMAAWRLRLPRDARALLLYAVNGSALFASMLLTYWGALHIPSGLISVIFGLLPLATGVFAAVWLAERALTRIRLAGLVVALAGLWLIFGQPWPGDADARLATAATLAGMTIQALGLVWVKRLGLSMPPLALTTGSLALAVPLFALAWLFFAQGTGPEAWPPHAVAATLYLGVAGSVVGFTLYYYVIQHMDTGRVALITLVTPVTALALGQTLNAEIIPPGGWAGIALVGAGLVLYEWRALIEARQPPTS